MGSNHASNPSNEDFNHESHYNTALKKTFVLMKKILLIGSRGYVGSYVHKECNKNFNVIPSMQYDINLFKINSFKKAFEKIKPDIIINCAGFAHLDKTNIKDLYTLNFISVLEIVNFLISIGYMGRFINTSSSQIFGNITDGLITEEKMHNPQNHYSIAKSCTDKLLNLINAELDSVTLTLFNTMGIGHRDTYLIPKLIKSFKEKADQIYLGNLNVVRDFTDIRDVARAYAFIAKQKNMHSRNLNICSGEGQSISHLISELELLTNHHPEIILKKEYMRENDNLEMIGCNKKILDLGFKFKYSLHDSLKWMLKIR